MKIKYDKEVDVIYIHLNNKAIRDSEEYAPGIIMDYDSDGSVIGIEILNASKKYR